MHVVLLVGAKDGLGGILVLVVVVKERGIANGLKLCKDGRNGLLPERAKTDDVLALRWSKVNAAWICCIVLQRSDVYVVRHKGILQLAQVACRVVDAALLFVV